MPAASPSPTGWIKSSIDCNDEIESARADKGERKCCGDHNAARQASQLAQQAAKLMRSARVALDRRDKQITTNQCDRQAPASGAVATNREHQALFRRRQLQRAFDVTGDAPGDKSGTAGEDGGRG